MSLSDGLQTRHLVAETGGAVLRVPADLLDTPESNRFFAEMTAMGRVGVADDVGPMVASLLGEENRWLTAQRVEV
ncbi:SDR family oxidoreductase [Paraburkholderia terrae]|uniref:hypothetical protein n=1 Tax=Paraburkholderia terrae TaxID=311230 RepID=UPI0030E2F61E